jgi:hypothetical protein
MEKPNTPTRPTFSTIDGAGPPAPPWHGIKAKDVVVRNPDGTNNVEAGVKKLRALMMPKPTRMERIDRAFCQAIIWTDEHGMARTTIIIGRIYDWATVRWPLNEFAYAWAQAKNPLDIARLKKSSHGEFLTRYGYTFDDPPSFRTRTFKARLEAGLVLPGVLRPIFSDLEERTRERKGNHGRMPGG